MAEKPTIYKCRIALSDIDRNLYDTLNITIARHPSETLERMMVRLLAYCFNAHAQLILCKGLSDTDEPALWLHSLDGNIDLWIDVGEPSVERIKKASHVAKAVKVYCFNSKAPTWWSLNAPAISKLSASVYQFDWTEIQPLAKLAERTMDASITITDGSAFIATALGECEVLPTQLQ